MDSKLDKLIEQRLQKITEKTIYTSPDGTEKTLTGDQKRGVKLATDKGDGVEIRKKGDIKEDGVQDKICTLAKLVLSDKIKPGTDQWTSAKGILGSHMDKGHYPAEVEDAFKKITDYEGKASKLNEEDGGGDSNDGTGDPIETGDQNDTVQHLYQIGLGFGGHLAKKKKKMSEVKKNSSATKIKRYMENAEKYMTKVNEELKKAIEHETKMLDEAEEEDNKKTNKFSDQVRHELSKMLKDKALVASAMEKYAGVMKTVKDEHDPKKIAKSILSTALKAKKPATA